MREGEVGALPRVYRLQVMPGSPPAARRRRWIASPRTDLALALLLGVAVLQSASDDQGMKEPAWAVIGLLELSVLPLAVRRSRPLAVLAITLVAAILGDLLFVGFQIPGPAIALYTVAAHRERRIAVAAAAVTALALVVPALAGGGVDEPAFVAAVYGVFAAAWALGDNLRTRRAYLRELEARAARLEREREETRAAGRRRGAGADRARAARRHRAQRQRDGRAGGRGGDVFDTRPDRAREALGSIESTGREALAELRRLLGVVSRPPTTARRRRSRRSPASRGSTS